MYILGLNAYHGDSSACIVHDGKLIAAAEEERFRRIKHWAGFPSQSIEYCLNEASIDLEKISHIAVNSDPRANIIRKIGFSIKNRPEFRLLLDRMRNARKRQSIEHTLAQSFPKHSFSGRVHFIEHHLAHLASAYLVSPFDNAVLVSVDGFGDFASAAWGTGINSTINVGGKVLFPHSLGTFYQAMTQFIGFPHYGDEYKVMGLAPYGEPKYLDHMRQIVKLLGDGSFRLDMDYFIYHKKRIDYDWDGGIPTVGQLFSEKLVDLLGPVRKANENLEQRHKDIARSVQAMYEEAFFHILRKLHSKHSIGDLCLAGGCAMNSVANGKIRQNTPFSRVYIQSAAGDAGGAIGAAFVVSNQMGMGDKRFVMDHAYFGPGFSNSDIERLLDNSKEDLEREKCTVQYIAEEDNLCCQTAHAISLGKVIGWFQGRMEWGPRALGNRSILGDPRRDDMKDILNLKIKRRESFRPFAPSILREEVSKWFESDADVPFMMQVFKIREEKRAEIPAVTHADGTGRLQTVHEQTNPRYHKLISSFKAATGVPMLLNTSFNENEPVVCTPKEALDCFLRTNMDVLVLENFYIYR